MALVVAVRVKQAVVAEAEVELVDEREVEVAAVVAVVALLE